jgi:integrase/recombinase XerD
MRPPLSPRMDPTRRCLKPENWPALDREAWARANEAVDVLDAGGAGARWPPATRRGISQSYGRWLTWLTFERPSVLALPFVERMQPEPIAAYISHLQRVNASCTVWGRIRLLAHAVVAMAPETDLIWMRSVIARLHRMMRPVRLKRHRLVEPAELFALGMATMVEAEAANASDWRQAEHYRDGLMIALLAARPLRLRNFTDIEIGRHLAHRSAGYQLRFEASEMKGRRAPLEFPLPTALVGCLEKYIATYRPVLSRRSEGGPPTPRLWVSSKGTPLPDYSLYLRIVTLTRARFGHPINPHLFRDCAATSIAERDPEHVLITKEILGHSTMRASERYYNHARSQLAISTYQAHVLALRRRIRKRPDRVGPKKFRKV